MQGIADGSDRDLLDIVALNVRTEINFGLFSDGCTSLAWQTEKRAWLAQNWDVRNYSSLVLARKERKKKKKRNIRQFITLHLLTRLASG